MLNLSIPWYGTEWPLKRLNSLRYRTEVHVFCATLVFITVSTKAAASSCPESDKSYWYNHSIYLTIMSNLLSSSLLISKPPNFPLPSYGWMPTKRLNSYFIWYSEDRASWYIPILKANEMQNFSNLYDKVLYMFRRVPLSIIRSISTPYTSNRYL